MAHHATDVHQWLSATGALLDEDTSLWLSPGDNPADGGLLIGSNGDTYYMPPVYAAAGSKEKGKKKEIAAMFCHCILNDFVTMFRWKSLSIESDPSVYKLIFCLQIIACYCHY
ncbi:uncharacterized protein LOC123429153 isoform X1 [Hordeum vulgare subsp. vulgare]|uniref:uncharacterized protein LOC123429153 isoform X1 n=1 Tax=Hordeum vulgare subsp. vulgare TaxID=112509 RepID=UPI001D1A56BF|nr:uncharacterized protein LOC123429153 isoform X1 [Hordeum vulgare subsp. vulgare]